MEKRNMSYQMVPPHNHRANKHSKKTSKQDYLLYT